MDDKFSKGVEPGIVYSDPHQQGRRPNLDDIRIFQSKAHVIDNPPKEVGEVLDYLFSELVVNPHQREVSSGPGFYQNRGRNPCDNEIGFIVDFLTSNPETVEFIIDHVIAKKHGVLSEELRSELVDNIGNSSLWTFSDGSVIRDTADTRESNKKLGAQLGFDIADDFHTDGEVPGGLRFVFSRHKPTIFKEGWLDRSFSGNFSVAQGAGEPKSPIEPDPGSILLFDSRNGYHSQPDMTLEEFSKIGGIREVLSLSFEFDRLIERAQQNIAERSKAPKPLIEGFGR